MDLLDFLPFTVTWVSILAQIILTFVLWSNYYEIYGLVILGYIFWGFSILFGFLPIFTFRIKGGISKDSSYIKTTKLVDTGIYSIVRHPQYLAGILWSIALAFISQYWVVDILLIPVIIATYLVTAKANSDLIEKFGAEYKNYKEKVPNLNVLWGVLLRFYRTIKKEKG